MTFKQIIHRLNRRDLPFFAKYSTTIKISIVILVAFVAIITTKNILAQEKTPNNPIKARQDNMMKGNNQESWLDNAMGSNLMSLQVMTAGTFPDSILDGKISPSDLTNRYIPGGLLGTANQIAAATFTPAASGILYIAQLKNNFLGKPVYAANTTGFEGLSNIMNLWKMSRNIVYVLISLFFVILGIMIMLRVKISPQSVVTIQSALPKVVTTLILVTFSYAIAGLCIDLISFLQPFAISLLFDNLKNGAQEQDLFPTSWGDWSLTGLVSFFQSLLSKVGLTKAPFAYDRLVNANIDTLMTMVSRLAPNMMILLLGAFIGGIMGAMMANPVTFFAGAGLGAIAAVVIVSVIILIYLIKLIFNLVKCYITILLSIIFAPFIIFMGIFPGSKEGFSKWLTTLIANLIVFPAVVLFLIIANILSENIHGGLWAPQLIVGQTWLLPLIFGIAAIGILSKLPTLIPEAIFNIKPSPFGKAIGEGLSSIPIVGGATKMAVSGAKEWAGDTINTRIGGTRFGQFVSGTKRSPPGQSQETGTTLPVEPPKDTDPAKVPARKISRHS